MKDKRILGLDLGSGALKLVLMEWREGGPVVTQMRLLELPPSDQTTRQAALKQLLQGISLAGMAQIVSVLDDPFACVHQVVVPPMPAAELAGAARWELQRHLAVSPEEAMVDYEILGEVESGGAKKLKLLAVGLPREAIQKHLSGLSEAGIKPTQLFPKACAIAAWTHRTAPAEEKGPVALLVIGANSSEFIVAQEGQPLFTRKIPVSGNDFTKGMTGTLVTGQGQMALTEAEAETIKRSVGIPQATSAEGGAKGISQTQLLALLRGNLERLVSEVERSIVFCGESTGGTNVQELILVGGGAHLKGLSDWLQERLKIRVSAPDPLKGFQREPVALQGPAGAMPLSFIPVLGAVLNAGKGPNLLPAEMKQVIQTQLQRAALTGVLTALIVGALFVRIGLGIYEKTLQAQIAAFQLERTAVTPQLAQARVAVAAQEQQARQPRWEEVFKELSQVVPREIYLTGLTIQGTEATLRGRVRESDRPADKILSDFQRAMGEGFFTQVRLTSTRQMEGPMKEADFEIRCLLR